MTTTPQSVLSLAFEAGVQPFGRADAYPNVLDAAQSLLAGRSSYFNDEYRKRFNIQVHKVLVSQQGLVLGVVESGAPEPGEKSRRYRCVLFRADGNVYYQTGDNRALDRHAAEADLRYQLHNLDDREVLKALCVTQMRSAAKLHAGSAQVLCILLQQGP